MGITSALRGSGWQLTELVRASSVRQFSVYALTPPSTAPLQEVR